MAGDLAVSFFSAGFAAALTVARTGAGGFLTAGAFAPGFTDLPDDGLLAATDLVDLAAALTGALAADFLVVLLTISSGSCDRCRTSSRL